MNHATPKYEHRLSKAEEWKPLTQATLTAGRLQLSETLFGVVIKT